MSPLLLLLFASLATLASTAPPPRAVDLVIRSERIWTGDPELPWARTVGVEGEKIAFVSSEAVAAPEGARLLDFGAHLVVPGFNDSHVHFAQAGALLLGVNLLDVADDDALRRRVAEAAARLPEGSWITRGDFGAYEAWARDSAGRSSKRAAYTPRPHALDEVAPRHPVLVTRYDGSVGLLNERAADLLGLPEGTRLLEGSALADALARVPPKSRERRLAESRRALLECRTFGVTSVQDMSPLDQVDLYRELRENGELTCRIHFSPARLDEVPGMIERGWTVGAGDPWLRFGTIKSHVDGIMGGRTARFFEPYSDNPPDRREWRGSWREYSKDWEDFERRLFEADKAGIQLRIHAIGDEANALLLDLFARIAARDPSRERRFRWVHAQVVREQDFARARGLGLIAEVQPFHVTDDMRWMEERIGAERCRGAYAFRRLADEGCVLAFGSDWPGTNASYYPINPILGIYAAVTRQTLKGEPRDGWFPDQRISLDEALIAYTRGAAYAQFEEHEKGTIRAGYLADFAVIDTDLFRTEPRDWIDARVVCTIVGGRIVHRLE